MNMTYEQPERVLSIYKPQGLTCLQTLDRLREVYPEYREAKLSYAGILDPLAEGVLLVLVGEENTRRGFYTGLDKVYEADVLFGVATDTFDVMGRVAQATSAEHLDRKRLEESLLAFVGTFEQAYPPYSSVRVEGRSLFEWARSGKLNEITLPKKERTVYDVEILRFRYVSREELSEHVHQVVRAVQGDFRQEEVLASWRKVLADTPVDMTFPVVTIRVRCSSGTYIRGIAHEAGHRIGCGALALSILRTQAGKYGVSTAWRL